MINDLHFLLRKLNLQVYSRPIQKGQMEAHRKGLRVFIVKITTVYLPGQKVIKILSVYFTLAMVRSLSLQMIFHITDCFI